MKLFCVDTTVSLKFVFKMNLVHICLLNVKLRPHRVHIAVASSCVINAAFFVAVGSSLSITLSHLCMGRLVMKYWLLLVLEVVYVFHTILCVFLYH